MTGALLILAVTIAIGVLLWAWERWRTSRHGSSLHHHAAPERAEESALVEPADVTQDRDARNVKSSSEVPCCGLHAICERTGQINEPPVYYDDEELDRFAGRNADEYTDEETEEFRDILLTLLPADASGWTVSLEKRRITLPAVLKPELELLLMER